MRALATCVLTAVVVTTLPGCASMSWDAVDTLEAQGLPGQAADFLEQNRHKFFRDKDAFLYLIEMGTLRHLQGSHAASNRFFEEAARVGEDLYTKSVSASLYSFVTNDSALPYYGESFERSFIHILSGLNYAMLGETEGAVVEARRVDDVLAKMKTDKKHKKVYKEDAFARYLSAMLYEERGKWNDAVVAYKLALKAYKRAEKWYGVRRPPSLLPAALAAAKRRGGSAATEMRRLYGTARPRSLPEGHGEAVVLHYNGRVPIKGETFFEISFGDGWAYVSPMEPKRKKDADVDTAFAAARAIAAHEIVRVAFPKYVPRHYVIREMEVSKRAGGPAAAGELVANIGAVAEKSLEDRLALIRTKAIARAVFKYAASKAICINAREEMSELAASFACAAAEIARIGFERADVRSWRTVPDRISIASTPLPEGSHDLVVRFRDAGGSVATERTIPSVQISSGERTFLVVRTVQ